MSAITANVFRAGNSKALRLPCALDVKAKTYEITPTPDGFLMDEIEVSAEWTPSFRLNHFEWWDLVLVAGESGVQFRGIWIRQYDDDNDITGVTRFADRQGSRLPVAALDGTDH